MYISLPQINDIYPSPNKFIYTPPQLNLYIPSPNEFIDIPPPIHLYTLLQIKLYIPHPK